MSTWRVSDLGRRALPRLTEMGFTVCAVAAPYGSCSGAIEKSKQVAGDLRKDCRPAWQVHTQVLGQDGVDQVVVSCLFLGQPAILRSRMGGAPRVGWPVPGCSRRGPGLRGPAAAPAARSSLDDPLATRAPARWCRPTLLPGSTALPGPASERRLTDRGPWYRQEQLSGPDVVSAAGAFVPREGPLSPCRPDGGR